MGGFRLKHTRAAKRGAKNARSARKSTQLPIKSLKPQNGKMDESYPQVGSKLVYRTANTAMTRKRPQEVYCEATVLKKVETGYRVIHYESGERCLVRHCDLMSRDVHPSMVWENGKWVLVLRRQSAAAVNTPVPQEHFVDDSRAKRTKRMSSMRSAIRKTVKLACPPSPPPVV